jgi:hypothetical protein
MCVVSIGRATRLTVDVIWVAQLARICPGNDAIHPTLPLSGCTANGGLGKHSLLRETWSTGSSAPEADIVKNCLALTWPSRGQRLFRTAPVHLMDIVSYCSTPRRPGGAAMSKASGYRYIGCIGLSGLGFLGFFVLQLCRAPGFQTVGIWRMSVTSPTDACWR